MVNCFDSKGDLTRSPFFLRISKKINIYDPIIIEGFALGRKKIQPLISAIFRDIENPS